MTKGLSNANAVTALSTERALTRKETVCLKASSTCSKGPALICKNINDVLQPIARDYRGLLVQRPQIRRDIQQHVDNLAEYGAFGEDRAAGEQVEVPVGKSKDHIAFDLSKKACRLASLAVQHGIPKDIGWRIQSDFEEIGMVLTKLVPTARKIDLGLVIVGENSCHRWHRDHDVCRALITYNHCGTQFVDHDHVSLRPSGNGGISSTAMVGDESRVCTAGVGDILIMKGTRFPTTPNGLVHRSPETCWHADGSLANRLLLRVALDC